MIIEISVSLIAIVLILWCILLTFAFFKMQALLKSSRKEVQKIESEALRLISAAGELICDIQSKSDSLEPLFRPIKSMRKSKFVKNGGAETVYEIIEWATASLALFHKIKNAVKSEK